MSDETAKRRTDDARRAQELRDRRKKAKVRQISFWICEGDEEQARTVMADLTDRAWLALFENGAIERRDDPARAAEIRARLETKSQASPHPAEHKES